MGSRAALLLAAAALLAGCGGGDDESSSSSSATDPRCEPATSALMTPLGNALKYERDRLREGHVVKSRDHEDIYFISAELDGPGFQHAGHVATWATTSPGGAAAIFSVDELAKDQTTWRDGTAIAGLSLEDDGARESRACVSAATR
jgi:hypothetical protein